MVETMNTYFSTIADKLASEFPKTEPIHTEPVKHQPKLVFSYVDEKHVE